MFSRSMIRFRAARLAVVAVTAVAVAMVSPGASATTDATAVETNDHGRVFGPAPLTGGGFVWSATFSREKFEVVTHGYVSFAQARGNLRAALLSKGASDLGVSALGNTYNTDTASTGDHDGNAVVLGLN
ncbi:hypothetical protein [Nocardia tengchongensis]